MDQHVTRDDMEIVSRVCSALGRIVGAERLELWLSRGVQYTVVDHSLRVAVAENFRLEYLRRTFRNDLAAAAREVLGGEPTVEFALDESSALSSPTLRVGQAQQTSPALAQAAPKSDATPTFEPPRLPRRQFASLDDFHTGPGNQVAYSAARGVIARPGQYSPLTLVGPPGCGKTHLLEGLWRAARTSGSFRRVIYLTAEQFTNQFLEALKQSGTPNFRRKYRDVELLLIDDVPFFAGKQSTVVELVHTIDTLLRDGRQVVFAADRPPAELRGLGSDLAARLSGGLVCPLAAADAATRRKIVEQLAARQGASIPPEVLTFVAGQLDGDARQLAGAVNRLAATGEALGRPIDLDLAQTALADLIGAARRPVRLPEIVDAVCEVFGVGSDQLQSTSKSPAITLPRMLVMFLA
ncbi:MAG: DnaA/Hda family protein, partial [Planctomycetaceae bacterium]|nr:DnaA/Hda family protein [Planctomycetaceae bacterium]